MRLQSASRSAGTVVITLLVVTAMIGAFAGAGGAQTSNTSGTQTAKADVVFVFDRTTSMSDERDVLKDEVENVADELDSSGIDARYGLVAYEDKDSTDVIQPYTSDAQELKDSLDFSFFGGTENASHGIQTALDMNSRADAKTIVVVITDEDDDGTAMSRQRTLDRLNSEGACLVSVSPDDEDPEELKTMAEQTDCGRWTDITSGSFTDVVRDLIDIIEDVTGGDGEPPAGPDFEIVERSLDKSEVHVGEPVNVTVTVENHGSAGTYHALLTANMESLRSERVEIGPGESHTFEWTLTFDEPMSTVVFFNYRSVGRLDVVERPPDPLAPEDVEVTDAYVTRSTVWHGESYDVVGVVRNAGDEPGLATIEYATCPSGEGDPTVVATDEVFLEPGETAERRHTVTIAEDPAKTLTQVWNVNGECAGSVTVLSLAELGSGVVDVHTGPGDVAPGEAYEVSAVVHNAGDDHRTFILHWERNGETVGFVPVAVAPGETTEVTRTAVAPDTGTSVDWRVDGVATTVQVTSEG